jgi:glutaredoxin
MENLVAIVCTAALIVCILYITGNLGIKPSAMKQHAQQHKPSVPQQPAPPLSQVEVFVSSECHHCVEFKPELDILEKRCKEEGVSYRLVVPSDPDVEIMMKSRNVNYFPCVLLKGKAYQAERTAEAILKALVEIK